MINKEMIEKIIGFIFIVFGISDIIFDESICKSLCLICTEQQISPCFFLFLFVGIIFIISGYSLVVMKKVRIPKKRTR